MIFECWDPAEGDDASVRILEAVDAEDAAAEFALWSDYQAAEVSDVQEVGVRGPDGAVRTFAVEARHEVSYYAVERRRSDEAG